MPTRTSAIDKARAALEEQIASIDDERRRIQSALDALGGSSPRRGRPPGSGARRGRPAGSGARKRSGTKRGAAPRRDQALRLIRANPGIRPSELARQMGVAAPYIYRVVPPLVEEGLVAKEGKGFVATG